ncbi:MAG: hypothetical protein ACLTJ5_03740 [Clostridium sp.]
MSMCMLMDLGVPMKDFVIESVDELPLTVTDSELFDIPVTKAGERWNQPVDWREGIYGGTGYYEFSLAEDSAPIARGDFCQRCQWKTRRNTDKQSFGRYSKNCELHPVKREGV